MRAARTITTFLATGAVAFASGYIVENGGRAAALVGASLQSPGMARASIRADVPNLPRPPIEALLATPLPVTRDWMMAQPESINLASLDRSRFDADPNQSCDATLKAVPADGGMIRVSLMSPCSNLEPVTLRHAGLSFSEQTTVNGRMTVEIPALVANATIDAVMPNGQTISTNVDVPEALDFHRVALVWRGETGLQIHAQEFGAAMGASGHVWVGSPGRGDLGADAKGGYLEIFGDRAIANATRAEVYTFPAGVAQDSGVVRLSIQAEVRNTNCGGMVAAQTLQPDGLGGMISSDLTLRLPECNRIGEHMVLKNILRDLKIASR